MDRKYSKIKLWFPNLNFGSGVSEQYLLCQLFNTPDSQILCLCFYANVGQHIPSS